MLSFVLRPRIAISHLSELPLTIAEVLRDELNARYGLNAAVKLPNDLTLGGRKVGGVLCQSHLRADSVEWVVCGIGLNTNITEQELQVPGSTSLHIETGLTFDHEELLGHLLAALDRLRAL
jgi:BirA family biotin operon repressor/biotin-[acetyl-CoA-carboxylase] ligase